MVFNSAVFPLQPGQTVFEDRFKYVELAVAFRKIACYRCDFSSFYRFAVLHLRRNPEITVAEDEEVRPDHIEIWKSIPRFAEISETVRCRRCNEVLGIYPNCIY